jgi:hypothetical protein
MSQDWADVYADMQAEQARQLSEVDLYVKRVVRSGFPGMDEVLGATGGGKCASMTNCDVVKIDSVTDSSGNPGRHKRTLSPTEVAVLADLASDPLFLAQLGQTFFIAQGELNQALPGELQGLGMLGVPVWMDPTQMLAAGGLMIMGAARATADAQQSLATSGQQAQDDAIQIEAAFTPLENQGTETVDGKTARKFGTPSGTTLTEQTVEDGKTAKITRAILWIDEARLAELKFRFEGTMEDGNESRDFFVEAVNSDFRNPPGCGDMYEPYRRVMRMGGMLDDAQMAEMAEARAQLAEFDAQMAALPAEQRQMMERLMGSQMEMLRGMTGDGAMEFAEQIEEIICNPDLASLFGTGSPSLSGSALGSGDPLSLLKRIQQYLVELGYMPGNTDGVLDVLTQVAISQFQAEHEQTVTGEPSLELAEFMADLVSE